MVAMLLGVARPAVAILGGQFDGNRHPNVALVLVDGQPICTGFLYRTAPSRTTSNLVATAGHCTSGETGRFSVTFDPTPSANSTYYAGTAFTDPDYATPPKFNNSLQQFATDDLGVIVLDQAVNGVVPADLPSVGQVDTLNLKTQKFTVVGYGYEGFHPAKNPLGGSRHARPADPDRRSVPAPRRRAERYLLRRLRWADLPGYRQHGRRRDLVGAELRLQRPQLRVPHRQP